MRDEATARWVAERLRALAGVRGMSQRALARQSGLKPEVVSRAFRGLHTPSVATLERLCAGLGIALADFFKDGSGGEPPGQAGASARVEAFVSSHDTDRLDRMLKELEPRARAQVVRGLELLMRSLGAPRPGLPVEVPSTARKLGRRSAP